MNRGGLFQGKEQKSRQKGLVLKKDGLKKQIHGKETKTIRKGNKGERRLKLNISQAINEALNDLKNIQEYNDYEAELIPQSPMKPVLDTEQEPISPIKEKQRRSSFDVTHTKSPIIVPKVSEEVIEPLALYTPEKYEETEKHPTEEELINETDRVMYLLSNLKNHARIPTKSVLASKQEEEFQSLIHTVITSRNALYIQDEEDIIHYYFTNNEVINLVDALRYESPYGTSTRSHLLELLCKYDMEYMERVTLCVHQFVWQYVLDERDLIIQSDDDYKTIQKQIGSIHRYVQLFQFLVESLRSDVAMNPPTSQEQMSVYLDQAGSLLRIVECFACTRSTIEKYIEMLSSLTLCLFSISPQEIAGFYHFLLRHWPRGYSEKVIGFIQFLENLLSSSPPLYLTPFLKDVVHKVFKKVCQELLGNQVEISKRCAYFLQNYYLRSNYIAVDQGIVVTVKTALEKGMDHWNEIVATICEKAVDLILDDI